MIILAAGASSRLGSPKQLVLFRQKPLLQHMIDLVNGMELATRVLVVGANESTVRQAIEPGSVQVIVNGQWQEGMAGSIRAGLSEVLKLDPETDRVLVLLSDQPLVKPDLLEDLLRALSEGDYSLAASVYRGQAGVPACFLSTHFDELLALTGDRGAKQLIAQHKPKAALVPFDMGELDIDTPADLARLRDLEAGNNELVTGMRFKIRYFGQLAERRGLAEEWLDWPAQAPTASELKEHLARLHGFDSSVQIAVNQRLAQAEVVQPEDEIALLPPFAGG